MLSRRILLTASLLLILSGAVAACTGGGSTTNPPPNNPSPSPSPGLAGTLDVVNGGTDRTNVTYGAANAVSVDFSCGCTHVAGSSITDASGNFTLVAQSTPVPTPNPTYTIVPGRNYLVVGNSTAAPQAWTVQFAGKSPGRDKFLNAGNQSDIYTAAVALYVFKYSTGADTAFDNWNFNALLAWYNHLKTSPTAADATLLNDIVTQSTGGAMLWPVAPTWRPGLNPLNATINADLATVHNNTPPDPTLPTPCPNSGCTGTPTP